ncbi:MAG: hypothetical protein QW810_04315 [Nitrososphaerota archaeon]
MEDLNLGFGFTLGWLALLTGGVLLILLITYLLRRVMPSKAVEIEEKTESKEEVGEEDLELIAGLSAVITTLSLPVKNKYIREPLTPTTSLWKISSILYSSRYEGGE